MASYISACLSKISNVSEYFSRSKRVLEQQKLVRNKDITSIAQQQSDIFEMLWNRNIFYPNLRKLKSIISDNPQIKEQIKNAFVTYYNSMGRDVSLNKFSNEILLKFLIEILISDTPSYSLEITSERDLEEMIKYACEVDPDNIHTKEELVRNLASTYNPYQQPPSAPRFHGAIVPQGFVPQPPSSTSSAFYQSPGQPPPDYYYGRAGKKKRAKKTRAKKTRGRKTRGRKTRARKTHTKRR